MTFEESNRTIREAVAARMAATPADDDKLIGYQPPECPGCEGHPFRTKVTGVAPAVATAIDLTQELPAEFVEATRHLTFRPATPQPPAEFKPQRIGASMPTGQLEAAWAAIKAKHEDTMARIRGEREPLAVEPLLPAEREPRRITSRLIGITGPAGCGKNLVASMIPDAVVIGLADPIYAALSVMLDMPTSLLRSRAAKEKPIAWLGKSPRQVLQTLGTEWGREMVRDDLWLTIAGRKIDELVAAGVAVVAIADVRFDNEAEMIRNRGGEVWRVERTPSSETYAHVSEAGISDSLIDWTIDNTGTPDQTRKLVMDALAR